MTQECPRFSFSLFPFCFFVVASRRRNIFPLRSPSAFDDVFPPLRRSSSLVIVILFFLLVDFSTAETLRIPSASNVTPKRRKGEEKTKRRSRERKRPRHLSLHGSRLLPPSIARPSAICFRFLSYFSPFCSPASIRGCLSERLTIPIEFLPIRAPTVTGRKEIPRHENRPFRLRCYPLSRPIHIRAREDPALLSSPFFSPLIARVAFRYSPFPGPIAP